MRILQLSKKFPYPLKDGEAIAVTYLAKAMHQLGVEMDLLSMNTSKHPFNIEELPSDFDHYQQIELVDIDNRLKVMDAFLNLFSNRSYHIERFISKDFEAKLIEMLQAKEYDVVQLETLYLAPYIETIREHSDARIAMRSHNVEHEIWKRIAENTNLGAKKWYLKLLTKRLQQFEVNSLNAYDVMVAITSRDLDFFKRLGMNIPAYAAPIGLDLQDYPHQPIDLVAAPTFSFIGSLDWMPNVEGLKWLLEEVWPLVIEAAPKAEFHIAGRNAPEWLLNLKQEGVKVVGEVPNAAEFIAAHEVMLVPLLSGSGMRVKILEGMAMGRLVISTTIGIEGIHAENEKEVLLADDPKAFAAQILLAYQSPDRLQSMAAAARQFMLAHYDNKQIAAGLLARYEALLGEKV
jgi:glycosyltransferase involved in cell wall biosynthesis